MSKARSVFAVKIQEPWVMHCNSCIGVTLVAIVLFSFLLPQCRPPLCVNSNHLPKPMIGIDQSSPVKLSSQQMDLIGEITSWASESGLSTSVLKHLAKITMCPAFSWIIVKRYEFVKVGQGNVDFFSIIAVVNSYSFDIVASVCVCQIFGVEKVSK